LDAVEHVHVDSLGLAEVVIEAADFDEDFVIMARVGFVGREVEVLVEGESRRRAHELCGRTGGNQMVNFDAPPSGANLVGRLVMVRVDGARTNTLAGALVVKPAAAA